MHFRATVFLRLRLDYQFCFKLVLLLFNGERKLQNWSILHLFAFKANMKHSCYFVLNGLAFNFVVIKLSSAAILYLAFFSIKM